MKFTPEVIAAIETLKKSAENDFERHRLDVLERDLTNPPRVEYLGEEYQRFNDVIYKRNTGGYYRAQTNIHRAVYSYYRGHIPESDIIHHRDFNPANNNVENLEMMNAIEHRKLHVSGQIPKPRVSFTCEYCGKVYETLNSGNNRFCSRECKDKAKYIESMETRVCAYCGKEFQASKFNGNKCCSQSCGMKLHWQSHHEERACPICGEKFDTVKRSKQTFCSVDCKNRHRTLQGTEEKICPQCGIKFRSQNSRPQKYCSRECYFYARNHSTR